MRRKLDNHLRSHRRRTGMRQKEVGYLLGNNGNPIYLYEHFVRTPNIQTALAYEAIFGVSVRKLFPGIYQKVELQVKSRAQALLHKVESGDEKLLKKMKLDALHRIADAKPK